MNYYELNFTLHQATEDYQKDILIDALGDQGFDTFEETDSGFKAYVAENTFNQQQVESSLASFKEMFEFSFTVELILQRNWNEEWESNFQPIQIDNKVRVRATFHQAAPEFPYEIIIDPKMAFGTGHHETTTMMMALMLENNFTGKTILDMGCGTGILAILASKLNAATITAIDYDPVCYDSTIENSRLNNIENIIPLCGSKEVIPDTLFDAILANINRNILLDQMEQYNEVLKSSGEIYFSGFYESPDLDIIKQEADKYGITYVSHKKMKEWVAAKFIKA